MGNRMKHKPKTYQDILGDFDGKVKAKRPDKHTKDKKDIHLDYSDMVSARDELETELLAYYNTTKGRMELDNSPHGRLTTRDAVALLMQNVDSTIIKRAKEGHKK